MTSALRWGGWSAPRPGRFTPGNSKNYIFNNEIFEQREKRHLGPSSFRRCDVKHLTHEQHQQQNDKSYYCPLPFHPPSTHQRTLKERNGVGQGMTTSEYSVGSAFCAFIHQVQGHCEIQLFQKRS